MLWKEFLSNIKNYKANYATKQLKLDFGTLSKLVYAGAFASMFGKDLNFEETQIAIEELRKALGSQAELSEAKKTELFGTKDLDSDVRLLLWRNQVLPTTKFKLADYFTNALTQLGLRATNDENMPFSNNSVDLWVSWNQVVSDPHIYRFYMQKPPPKTIAFIGMIEDVATFPYKDGTKEALKFKLFTGIDCIPSVVVWAERDGAVHPALKKAIVKKAYGVAEIRLQEYHGEITASLNTWNTIRS
jgi:hypothetical protein